MINVPVYINQDQDRGEEGRLTYAESAGGNSRIQPEEKDNARSHTGIRRSNLRRDATIVFLSRRRPRGEGDLVGVVRSTRALQANQLAEEIHKIMAVILPNGET
jgi:hypothetical protein